MKPEKGKIERRKTVYRGRVFSVEQLNITTPDNMQIERDLITTGPTVTILAISRQGHVVITSEYRVGVNQDSVSLPAGLINSGESAENAAIRELKEETGYVATSCKVMTTITSSEGFMNQTAALVLIDFDETNRVSKQFDADEFVKTTLADWDDVVDWVQSGRINTAQGLGAILYYQQFIHQPK